jgi:hypothetical protein
MKHRINQLFSQLLVAVAIAVFAAGCASKPDAASEAKIAELQSKVDAYEASAKLGNDNLVSHEKLDMEVWNKRDSAGLAALHDPTLKAHFNGGPEEDFTKHITDMAGMLKSPQFPKVTSIPVKFSNGEWTAAVENFEMPGKDGKPVMGAFGTFMKWKDGKVVEEHTFVDMSSMMPPASEKK